VSGWLRRLVGVAAALVVACGSQPSGGVPMPVGEGPKLPLGMNLTGIRDYAPGYPFRNLMWGARRWLTRNADGSGPFDTRQLSRIPLDEDGYPLELPYRVSDDQPPQVVFTIIPNVTEPGHYVALYDGEGRLTGAMGTTIVTARPGRVVLDLRNVGNDSRYEGIAILESKRGNHIRNIRIVSLADAAADLRANPFREDFLRYCRQWHVLRFMDWMETNQSTQKHWADRRRPTHYTMAGPPGVALEWMVDLANRTETDPWFCMPHQATPEYLTAFARFVKQRLDPRRRVYVEYSNEVWNWQFPQSHWVLHSRQPAAAMEATGRSPWRDGVVPLFNADGVATNNAGHHHPERIAAMARHCFAAWEQVFAGADRARLVRVIGVQHDWPDTARRTVRWVMEQGGADAVAPAGYFGPDKTIYERWEAAGANLSVEQVVADLDEVFESKTARRTREIAGIAREYGLRFVVYEGGQHIQPRDQKETTYMPALRAAQYHPGLAEIYRKNFRLHLEEGCDLFCVFSSIGRQGTRWGSWGHQEYYGQPPSEIPKFAVLLEFNAPKRRP
jgi:hypothetical protein